MKRVSDQLDIFRNGALAYSFDKREGLARMQFAYVQRMDADMDRGISLEGERILSPDHAQRTRYVIGQLLEAVNINDSRAIAMLCRWLAQQVSDLDAIRIEDHGDEVGVELNYSVAGTD
jgi:hypothetical protein